MRLITIDNVAHRLQVSRSRAYELVRIGIIPSVRMGRQVRVEEDALRRWAEAGGRTLRNSASEEAATTSVLQAE